MSGPSVADVVAFESLPEDVQEIARRALGFEVKPSPEMLADAYQEGWDDCEDSMMPMHASAPRREKIVKYFATGKWS